MLKLLLGSKSYSLLDFISPRDLAESAEITRVDSWDEVRIKAPFCDILVLEWSLVPMTEALRDFQAFPLRILFLIHNEEWVQASGLLEAQMHWDYVRYPLNPSEILFRLHRLAGYQKAVNELDLHKKELDLVNHRLQLIIESTREIALTEKAEEIGPLLMKRFSHNMAAEGGSLFWLKKRACGGSFPSIPDTPLILFLSPWTREVRYGKSCRPARRFSFPTWKDLP